jgi:hypothetical protein
MAANHGRKSRRGRMAEPDPESEHRFSEKISLKQKDRAG